MFKRKKKKTGCETPEYRCPAMPPVAKPKEERCYTRTVRRSLVGTQDAFPSLASNPSYDDILKIENADVYWSDKSGAIIVVTTPEWRDYLTGKRDTPFIEKENKIMNNKTMYGLNLYIPFEDLDAYIHEHIDKNYGDCHFIPIKVGINEVDLSIDIKLLSASSAEIDNNRYKLDLNELPKENTK